MGLPPDQDTVFQAILSILLFVAVIVIIIVVL